MNNITKLFIQAVKKVDGKKGIETLKKMGATKNQLKKIN